MVSVLGENIQRIRKLKGMSAYELAKKAGVGGATVSQIESGKRATLKGDTLDKIAGALGVPPGELFGDADTIQFETNSIMDILNIINMSEWLTVDDEVLNRNEKQLINIAITMATSTIRYNREHGHFLK